MLIYCIFRCDLWPCKDYEYCC